jgi:sugar phosphate permease
MTSRQKNSLMLPAAMFMVATFFYLYEFLLRVSPNVFQEELSFAFNIDATKFGLFSSLWYWVYAPLQLPVGALTDKYGPRRLLTFAILLCCLSALVLAYTQSFVVGCIARALIGAGSAFAFISCLKIAHIWFDPRWFSLMTGITLTIGTLGAAVGGTPLQFALDYVSWRDLLNYIGILGIFLAFFAWITIRDHNPDHPEIEMQSKETPGFWKCLTEVARQPQSWIVGIYALFVTAPTDAFGGTWGVRFFTDVHGLSREVASTAAVTMTFLGMAVGSSFLGWVSNVFDNRKMPMAIAAFIASIALTFIVFWPQLSDFWAMFLCFVFGASGTYVLAFVMTRRFSESIYVATAVGFVNMVSMLGSAGLTFLIGWMLDTVHTGGFNPAGEPFYEVRDYQLSYVALPIFYAISAFLVVPFVRDGKS